MPYLGYGTVVIAISLASVAAASVAVLFRLVRDREIEELPPLAPSDALIKNAHQLGIKGDVPRCTIMGTMPSNCEPLFRPRVLLCGRYRSLDFGSLRCPAALGSGGLRHGFTYSPTSMWWRHCGRFGSAVNEVF